MKLSSSVTQPAAKDNHSIQPNCLSAMKSASCISSKSKRKITRPRQKSTMLTIKTKRRWFFRCAPSDAIGSVGSKAAAPTVVCSMPCDRSHRGANTLATVPCSARTTRRAQRATWCWRRGAPPPRSLATPARRRQSSLARPCRSLRGRGGRVTTLSLYLAVLPAVLARGATCCSCSTTRISATSSRSSYMYMYIGGYNYM